MTFEVAFFRAFERAGFTASSFVRHLRKPAEDGNVYLDKKLIPYEAVATERVDAVLWECLVTMFGEWELSPRTGWVTDPDSAAAWVEIWAERARNGI